MNPPNLFIGSKIANISRIPAPEYFVLIKEPSLHYGYKSGEYCKMTIPSDAECINLIRSGNQDAYKELISRYQGHVYGLAYSSCGNWTDAQDIAQETFIRAYLNLDQIQHPERFRRLVARVAFSVAMNWIKSFRPKLYKQLDGRVDLDQLEIPDFNPGQPRWRRNATWPKPSSGPYRPCRPSTGFR